MIRLALSLATVSLAALALAAPSPALAQSSPKVKFILNWKYQGPQAWFFIAEDRGYFKAEGVDIEFDQGEGSGAPAVKIASGAYNAGFGDINAIIALAAAKPQDAPIGVYMMYNVPPFVIATKKSSGIKSPKDLEGKTLGGAGNDAALKLFPAFAKLAKVDPGKVSITNMAPNLREQMLQRGQVDAVFGYVNTIWFSAKPLGIDPANDLVWMKYSDYGMDLYSNTIMVSKQLAKDHPQVVRGMLKALNRAIAEVAGNMEPGMDAVMKREPLLRRDTEKERLVATIKAEMSHPETKDIGFGDVSDDRLKRSIVMVVEAYGLPRAPAPGEIFDRQFLPAKADRMMKF
ncbi:MAG: ABC transporter substrate-binding protein [Bacteroidota bacterium]